MTIFGFILISRIGCDRLMISLLEVRQVYQDDYALATIREGDEYLGWCC